MSLFGPRPWPVTLHHGPVGLRPIHVRDEPVWNELRQRNQHWTGEWDSTRPPEAEGELFTFSQLVRHFTRQAKQGRMLPWMITYADADALDPVVAGQMTISGITLGSARWAQAGYWVDQRWAGRGIAPLALAMAGDYVLGTLRLHRLEVAIRPENAKSLRVVEKLGLPYEGLRPRYLHVDGDWRDHLVFVADAEQIGPGGLVGRLGC